MSKRLEKNNVTSIKQKLHNALQKNSRGRVLQNAANVITVFDHDPELSGFAYDEFNGRVRVTGKLPWREDGDFSDWSNHDFAMLALYLDRVFGIVKQSIIENGWSYAARKRTFHPVKKYLQSLTWDGVKRADTLLIDYLGAPDTPYVRTVTRKTLAAAIARIMSPGIKFDSVLTLFGGQGIGKSWLFRKLAKDWFTDSLTKLGGKEAMETLHGKWIIELSELASMRRSEIEEAKMFISAQEDHYRPSYGRVAETFKRQCIFVGSTNQRDFLTDKTGNRRFWPVEVSAEKRKFLISELTDEVVDKIWSEVMTFWKTEPLYLDGEMLQVAEKERIGFTEDDPLSGKIEEYLNIKLPPDWERYDIWKRTRFFEEGGVTEDGSPGTVTRDKVCAIEIWREMLGEKRDLPPHRRRQIVSILDNMPGWQRYKGSKEGKLRFGSLYGKQIAYVRSDPDEARSC
ncbi:VapE domain-containing protein [Brevibacillus panacihumi]|uniref:VapE domain-containing protein n=1 Tax=Brevibacillus panacihumi TaxID=497735 RepID=UPI003D0955DB